LTCNKIFLHAKQ
jgi:hypothetical protein